MATWINKSCPYCGHTYRYTSSSNIREYGCPLLNCPRCHKSFWDTDIKEPALYGFQNSYEDGKKAKKIITAILVLPMIAIMTTGGVLLLIDKEWIGLFLLVMGGNIGFCTC